MSSKMFDHSGQTEARGYGDFRGRWILIGSGVIVIMGGLVFGSSFFQSSPYSELAGRLRPGMTSDQVTAELGDPSVEDSEGRFLIPGLSASDGAVPFTMWYEVGGTDVPLIVQLTNNTYPHRVEQWCVFVAGKPDVSSLAVPRITQAGGRKAVEWRVVSDRKLQCHKID